MVPGATPPHYANPTRPHWLTPALLTPDWTPQASLLRPDWSSRRGWLFHWTIRCALLPHWLDSEVFVADWLLRHGLKLCLPSQPTGCQAQHPLRASPAGTSGVWRVTSGLSAALPAVSSTSPYFRPSGGLSPARAEKTADRLRLPSPPRWGPQEKMRRLLGRDLCRQKKRGTVPSSERADFEAIGGKTRSNAGLPAVPPHPPVPGGFQGQVG